MKIAVDCREFRDKQKTGIARFLENFLNNIEEAAKKDVYLLTDTHTSGFGQRAGYAVLRVSAPCTLYYDQITIPHLLRREAIDVFFSPYYKMPFFTSAKRVITIHDLHFLKKMLRHGAAALFPFVTYLKGAGRLADRIITSSDFSKSEIIRILGVPAGKIAVVYNGVDGRFKAAEAGLKERLIRHYALDSAYILYVGNLKPHKNVTGLVRAYGLLAETLRNKYRLVIIARKDEHYPGLARFINEQGLGRSVVCIDFVSDEDLVLFYTFAAAVVFPSFYEGFGLPPLEAMACGTPVVASSATSLPEILQDAALYADPYSAADLASKISVVLEDEDRRRAMSCQGLRHVKKYDTKVFAQSLFYQIASV